MNLQFNSKEILITQLGDEGVAFNSVTNEYFSLNETSFTILKKIENNLSVPEICEQLSNEYDILKEDCEKEVNKTIELFKAKKLVVEA